MVFRANTRPYLNEIPAHFIHAIKTKGYDVIGINASCAKKWSERSLLYY